MIEYMFAASFIVGGLAALVQTLALALIAILLVLALLYVIGRIISGTLRVIFAVGEWALKKVLT